MRIANEITATIGRTPLVRINRLLKDQPYQVDLLVKMESFNPGGSVKDRAATAIINQAERSGALKPGGTIVEATSGNTGIALAMAGAARGYRVVITMPESMSRERQVLMRAYGAELVLTPASKGMQGTVDAANEIVAHTDNAIIASQFSNPANPLAHYRNTAQEIWEDTEGTVDAFVAGIGTAGTITGVGRALREMDPNIQIFGVEPAESPLLTQQKAGPHLIQGIGANFQPDNLDFAVITSVLTVPGEAAIKMARRAAREEGLLVGISSGAALLGAKQLAARPEFAGKRIVALLPDGAERYLSTALFADLLETK